MTKDKAIHDFFSSFGMTAYKSTAVPDDVTFPYLVYQANTGFFEGDSYPVSCTVQLFFYTDSESVPNAMVESIASEIGTGKLLTCDTGCIWVYRGNPWCQSLVDDTSPTIKVRNLNFTMKFFTT